MKTVISLFFILMATVLLAQENTKPASFGVHYSYTDFGTAAKITSSSINDVLNNKQWAIPSEMMMGLGIDFFKGLTKKIDFTASFNYANGISGFNLLASNLVRYPLYTLDAQLNFKMVSDKYYVRPFIIAGAGAYQQNGVGFYAPLGVGLQFNIFNAAILNIQTVYRLPIKNTENGNLFYQIGFATALKKTRPATKKISNAQEPMVVITTPTPTKKEIIKDILVSVIDEETLLPLPSVQVTIMEDSTNAVISASTNETGQAYFKGIQSAKYAVLGRLNGIATNTIAIDSNLFNADANPIQIILKHNDPRFTLIGKAIDSSNLKPVGGAIISLISKNQIDTTVTNVQDGGFKIQLAPATDYTISGKKNGYMSNIEQASTVGLKRSTTLYVSLTIGIQNARGGKSIVMDHIYFETGKSTLKTSTSADLNKLVLFLRDNPTMKVEITGYTDNVGTEKVNQRLSFNRAQSIVAYLIENKILSNHLSAIGLGSANPIASNSTTEGRSKNRRVEIKVLD